MKFVKRKGRLALIAILGITITTFCIEYLSYIHNAGGWPTLPHGGDDVVARILFVADPQIIGEKNEHYLYNWMARRDADWYLQKTYQMAKRHISPDVVIFLGDLFDEGSTADDPEYRRYFQRFSNIFELPSDQNPSPIKHIFVPGDNDVGGEKDEPVDPVKIAWFTKVFGELRSVVDFSSKGVDVQFVKMNLFMPSEYKDPMRGFHHVINETKKPDIRLIVSHVSLLSFMTSSVEQVLEAFQPNLIIAAHSHQSSYLKMVAGQKSFTHIIRDFLLPEKSHDIKSSSATEPNTLDQQNPLLKQTSFQLDLKSSGTTRDLHEILVPTCSYRMGVPDMGYGAMQIYRNGSMEYTVLWLPSRYKQLYLYIVIYILAKIIFTPWALWKIGTYIHKKVYECRIAERVGQYVKIV